MMPKHMILEMTDVTREFKRRGRTFPAVDRVSLSLAEGEFAAIVGRSGNGKSTLLNLVAGLLRPTSGSIRVDGEDIVAMTDNAMSELRNTSIGFVTQSHTLLPNLAAIDNVMLPAVLRRHEIEVAKTGKPRVPHDETDGTRVPDAVDDGLPDVIAADSAIRNVGSPRRSHLALRAHELLRGFGVDDLASCYPKELSGGEMRRISIARALMNDPRLLIADEPTGDLDAESTAIVMRELHRATRHGVAVLMATHDPDALAYATRAYRMDGGRLGEI